LNDACCAAVLYEAERKGCTGAGVISGACIDSSRPYVEGARCTL
jgi:hypothetical protein